MSSSSTTSNIPERYALPSLPELPLADPSSSILDAFRLAAAQVVSEAVNIDLSKAYDGVDFGKKQADLYIAMARFRLGGKPDQWADKVVAHFKPSKYLKACSATGGFVGFTIDPDVFAFHVLRQIRMVSPHARNGESVKPLDEQAQSRGYGSNTSGKGKKMIVDYSAPNIAKPFHAGHLRSTIIGAFIANLYESQGWEVVRWNYIGDWGKQFGLLAVGYNRYGDKQELETNAIKHLFEIYVRINAEAEKEPSIHDEARAFFKRMEDGDAEALALWKQFRDLSIKRFEPTYARLNIRFDNYNGESSVNPEYMDRQMRILEEKKMLTQEKGAELIDLEQHKLGKVIVKKGDGTSIYITRDLGGALQRMEEYKPDKIIYVIASQQDLHCKQFFKTLELMGYEWSKNLLHINFGMVLGMSTRKGTVKFLDDILDEAKTSMHEQMAKNEEKYAQIEDPEYTSDVIGMTAVKIQDMSGKRINNYTFDPKRMTSFEGDTGPYIQYSHVRLCSIERKNPNVVLPKDTSEVKVELLTEPKAREILNLIANYPTVVKTAFGNHEPSTIVTYCFQLTHAVSSAWDILNVKGVEHDLALARFYLFMCTRDVLASAMRLLTLTPLDRM